jgi:hypothetical protein
MPGCPRRLDDAPPSWRALPDRTCLQRIDKRNIERPEESHHLTEEDFVHIPSFFEAPGKAEGFRIEIHAAAGA